MRRRLAVVALAGVVACGASSCGGLPTSSDVRQGDPVDGGQPPPLRLHLPGPAVGAQAQDIVTGFLMAGAQLSDDYRAAREFIEPGLASRWEPRSRTALLYDGGKALKADAPTYQGDTASVRVTIQASARFEPDGHLVELSQAEPQAGVFRLVRRGSEWRISDFPPDFGLWLDSVFFPTSYQPYSIFYASAAPSDRVLIPDRRYLPFTTSLPTALARALLDTPPAYLHDAVTTGFPPLTRLSVDAVPVDGGAARLDLTSTAEGGTAEARRAALAQAIATLTQSTAVSTVRLSSEGRPLAITGVDGDPSSAARLGYLPTAGRVSRWIVVRRGNLLTVLGRDELRGEVIDVARPKLPALDPVFDKVAVSPDLRDLAAVSSDGGAMIRWRHGDTAEDGGESKPQPPFGTRLLRPAYDGRRGLWVSGRDAADQSAFWVIDTRGVVGEAVPRRLQATWLGGRTVEAFSIAPDSQRVAMAIREATGQLRLGVSGISRGTDERPTGLSQPLFIGGLLQEISDLDWFSAHQLSVLGSLSRGGEPRVLTADLTGRVEQRADQTLPATSRPKRLIVNAGQVITVSDTGRLSLNVSGGWVTGVSGGDVIVPGPAPPVADQPGG